MSNEDTLLQRSLIKWVNRKLEDDSIDPQTPTSNYTNIPSSINNLSRDLQDGLVLIKLINRIIYETSLACQNIDGTEENLELYYLTPIYKKPTFKIHKIEVIQDLLQFLRLSLNIDTSYIGAENIFDGDCKIIICLIWSIFLFSESKHTTKLSSILDIRNRLLEWINGILSKKSGIEVTNFARDWAIEKNPEKLVYDIISHYDEHISEGLDLSETFTYIQEALPIPDFITQEYFEHGAPDEKCMMIYFLELYQILEVDLTYEKMKILDSQRYDDVIDCIVSTYRLKTKYERKSSLTLQKITINLNKLQKDLTDFMELTDDNHIVNQFTSFLRLLEDSINGRVKSDQLNCDYSKLRGLVDNMLRIIKSWEEFGLSVKPEILYQSYPEIIQYLSVIKRDLLHLGDIEYISPNKQISIEPISTKLNQLLDLESVFLQKIVLVIYNLLNNDEGVQLGPINDQMPGVLDQPLKLECQKMFDYLFGFYDKLQFLLELIDTSNENISEMFTPGSKISKPESSANKEVYQLFRSKLLKFDKFGQEELNEVLVDSIVTEGFPKNKLNLFMKLIPNKTDLTSSTSESEFELVSCSSSNFLSFDEDVFDEIPMNLTSARNKSGKINDIYGFFEKLENGFKL